MCASKNDVISACAHAGGLWAYSFESLLFVDHFLCPTWLEQATVEELWAGMCFWSTLASLTYAAEWMRSERRCHAWMIAGDAKYTFCAPNGRSHASGPSREQESVLCERSVFEIVFIFFLRCFWVFLDDWKCVWELVMRFIWFLSVLDFIDRDRTWKVRSCVEGAVKFQCLQIKNLRKFFFSPFFQWKYVTGDHRNLRAKFEDNWMRARQGKTELCGWLSIFFFRCNGLSLTLFVSLCSRSSRCLFRLKQDRRELRDEAYWLGSLLADCHDRGAWNRRL